MTTSHNRTVVIGGGISGLATAALLARDGQRVTLLERREVLGGRAGTWEQDGFTFDTGPSWYLMPEVFDHFYRLLGTSASRPTVERGVAALALVRDGETMLFDCGEGTQRQMMRYGVSFNFGDLFFTHFHTDHFLGVLGLLRTMTLRWPARSRWRRPWPTS